jgi:hypothetical protein
VVVPLIVDLERLDAPRDRVLGEFIVVGVPVRIDRPVGFEVPAGPFEKRIA